MAFRSTQLGRFGDFIQSWDTDADPDRRAAHIAARPVSGATDVPALLGSKGLWVRSDPAWRAWLRTFGSLVGSPTSSLLPVRCSRPHPHYPFQCWHELLPPLEHGNLRWFAARLASGGVADNLSLDANGAPYIPRDAVAWNFVVTQAGEILVSREQYDAVKHPCISGGVDVWSAGRVGVESRLVRLVDLQSGHFVRAALLKGTTAARALVATTKRLFQGYDAALLRPSVLHPGFDCAW